MSENSVSRRITISDINQLRGLSVDQIEHQLTEEQMKNLAGYFDIELGDTTHDNAIIIHGAIQKSPGTNPSEPRLPDIIIDDTESITNKWKPTMDQWNKLTVNEKRDIAKLHKMPVPNNHSHANQLYAQHLPVCQCKIVPPSDKSVSQPKTKQRTSEKSSVQSANNVIAPSNNQYNSIR